ncbi:TRAP transporter substrate-binding protein DctP [Desulforhopalus sp. IMCC35007]|uniref:TRAP transporter substrate-binding protein n=1 Tax=Desulforhopalus sp. IMCC35007 TaxID=2569543 RepID=UPI0010AEE098|nr:TRAP transporter substrate-binding protein DctP [Desulforhopalus sp. IMCC35007]TKB06534.1 C4-dicarboxylate ABC transporter substrate-binding protein [Desulforhopalus sp. IMCC35007]
MLRKILMATAILLIIASTAQAEKVLRLTLQLPAAHHLGKNVQAFADEVAAKTGGEIKLEIYPSAQLYKDSEVPQAVASGAVEMGVASVSQFAGTIPAVDLFYVPFLFRSQEALNKAVAKGSPVRQPLDDAILATGARVLWWQAYGGSVILSKDTPVVVPDDLKGKKVRVFSKTLGELINAAGGAPTSISGSEQFLAYQRGTVDVGLTGVTAVKSRKLFQVMDHLTATQSMVDIEFIVIINEKVWQGLTEDQQAILDAAARKVEKELREQMMTLETEAFEFVKDKINVVQLTDEQLAQWQQLSTPVVEAFVKNAGPLGQQVVDAARAIK